MTTEEAEKFWVENPEWTFGRKLVVLATDYDKVLAENITLRLQLVKVTEARDEWEKAARLARTQRGLLKVVK